MHDDERLANLFGAAALAATGAMTAAAAAVTDGGLSAAAALVTLASEPGIGVTELSRRLGLSQPGASRLIEALAARGLVHSEPAGASSASRGRAGQHGEPKGRLNSAPQASSRHGEPEAAGRSVSLRLTSAGGEKARLILAGRERALAALLAPLSERARRELDAALSAVLERMTEDGAPVHRTCRLCDEQACIAAAPCPVEQAWRRRSGP
jgi:DNA-binding MarR family transcriptional regulator